MRAAASDASPRVPRLFAALLVVALAAAVPRGAAAPSSASRAHRSAHRENVRHAKHVADRRDRLSESAAVGSGGDTALLDATAGMCNFMEREAFTEYFQKEMNTTRWDLDSMNGLFHCNRGTDEYCTMGAARRAARRSAGAARRVATRGRRTC